MGIGNCKFLIFNPRRGGRRFGLFLLATLLLTSRAFAQEPQKRSKDPWFGKDKVKHFVVSVALAGAGYYAAHTTLKMRKEKARAVTAGVTLSIGLGKEIFDRKRSPTGFSKRDLAADALGCGVGIATLTTR